MMIAAQNSLNIESLDPGPLYEPEAISYTFESPGWYFVAVVLLLIVIFMAVKWVRKYLKNAYRRESLKSLSIIEARFIRQQEVEYLKDALVLLKLVAIHAFGRENVAPLHGNDWLVFLEEKGNQTPFRRYSSSISAALYNSAEVEMSQVEKIIALSKRWIMTHA